MYDLIPLLGVALVILLLLLYTFFPRRKRKDSTLTEYQTSAENKAYQDSWARHHEVVAELLKDRPDLNRLYDAPGVPTKLSTRPHLTLVKND